MKQNFKEKFYIFCFALLGALLGFLVSAWSELLTMRIEPLLISLSTIAFAILGFWSGQYWWKQIYVLQRYTDLPHKNKKFLEIIFFLIIIGGIIVLGAQNNKPATIIAAQNQAMQITSSAFVSGAAIPKIYTCEGQGINPPISFEDIPTNAQSLAFILHDPDAPMAGGFTHWTVFNIPPTTKGFAQNALPSGVQGINSAGERAYAPICPPSGTHEYDFYLYALDTRFDPLTISDEKSLRQAMSGHILAEAQLTATFKK